MVGTVYRWCVTAFSSHLWKISTPIDQVLDGHIVQMHIKIDALCEQQWLLEQHAGKKSKHMLRLHLCHQGPLGTVYLQQDSDHVCLWPLTPQHCEAQLVWCHEGVDWRMEWRSVVFIESRFCLYANDGCSPVWHRCCEHHLLECIHPWHSGFMVWRAISYNLQSHLCFCRVK